MNPATPHIGNTAVRAGFLLLFLVTAFTCRAQVSDYEVYRSFISTYGELEQKLEDTDRSAEADTLMKRIRRLELKYDDHLELMDKVLYPDSYYGRINRLKQKAVTLRDRLIRREILLARVEELNRRVASHEERLVRMDRRSDSLWSAIRSAEGRERDLTGLIREYRERAEQRDRFILDMVDSLLVTYRSLELQIPQDLNRSERTAIGSDRNALELIRYVAAENSEYLESSTVLSPEDYLRMKTVQVTFRRMWNRLGDRLIALYAPEHPERTRTEVEEALRRWGERVTNQMWIALNASIQNHDLPVGEVNSREELFSEINDYVRSAAENSRKGNSREHYEAYTRFRNFWTERVKMNWAQYAVRAEILTHRQIAEVDRNMEQWQETSRPSSNLLGYLIGIAVIALILVSVLWIRDRNGM